MMLRKDKVELNNGHVINDYFVIEKADWVNVIAITEEGKFVFERQYRHGASMNFTFLARGVRKAT